LEEYFDDIRSLMGETVICALVVDDQSDAEYSAGKVKLGLRMLNQRLKAGKFVAEEIRRRVEAGEP
jgi:hypothetical protein